MKTNAIIRIVCFSLGILILLAIMGSVLMAQRFFFDIKESGLLTVVDQILMVDESDDIRIDGTGSSVDYDAAQIRDINIEWVSGAIIIQPGDTQTIHIEESSVTDSDYQMVAKCSGDELTLKFCHENIANWGIGVNSNTNISKDLMITVPRDWICDTLEIDTASARVEISDLQFNEVNFDGASGKFLLNNCNIMDLDIDTASGDVEFSGILKDLDFDAASAKFDGEFYNVPNHLKLDTMSSDTKITLPEGSGFVVAHDSMSGSFQSDFQFTSSGNHYKCGNGSCQIDINSMSGDVHILKGTPAENCDH